ncbi:hypothetical protein A6A04_02540 [Paramagnetospirillum marisnigri]|uniref:protein O-GlcNAc transferase n=1 Tax=Paramagnetospirillum marisnigri TaxID=1285242 RepID=A0A178MNM6_9PROT|nr:tetratricopeptide repeat protein [Paramagnetospirillum marisnigri]OAN50296.1 hypothetical protein A6A04_02540 [Paramagnetospirillum marisnigri]
MPLPAIDEVLALHRAGRLDEAERLYLALLDTEPGHAMAWHLAGVVAYQTGRKPLAAERMGRAVELRPDFPEAHNNLGNALKDLGQPERALSHYDRALALKPDFPEPRFNRGSVLHELGRLDEAVASYQAAIALRPDYVDALSNLGLALRELDRMDEALAVLRRAVVLRPDHAEALSNLGLILLKRERIAEAIETLRRAVAANPRHARAHANLGLALEEAGEIEQAASAHLTALSLDPGFEDPLPHLVHLRRKLCLWDRFESDDIRLVELARAGNLRIPPFILLHSPTATQADHQTAARRWAAGIKPPSGLSLPARPRSDGPVHLAYLSGDLRAHPVGYLMGELLERHERSRFRVSAYSFGPDDGSPSRQRLAAAVDAFVDIRGLDDAEAAARIHADAVDILVDLTGYTTGARTAILAARPAPVQVNWLGYAGTMGAGFMDHLLADAAIAPLAEQPWFDERIWHLPHSYLPFDTRRSVAARRAGRAECGLPESGLVFCAFHNAFKITPAVFDVWMRLLAAVPGSVLWLLAGVPAAIANLRREAGARGVDPDRLVFAPRVGVEDYLALHRLADLYLDVLPYNAHGSAADALWMGLPVLSCAGATFPGRVAGRLLEGLGLPELVTSSLAAYEAKALELARDPAKLADLRQRLARARESSPIFDMAGFARGLEVAYEGMIEP